MKVTLITASAGTGKTTRLTGCYTAAVERGMPPATILATTFTRKAAGELIERVRGALAATDPAAARGVLSSPVGTIDAVCGRLVAEHALALGLSPELKVLDEKEQSAFFKAAVEDVMQRYDAALRPCAARLGIEDWRDVVRAILDAARPNGLDAEALRGCGPRSWQGFARLLDPPRTGEDLDAVLAAALAQALAVLEPVAERLTRKTHGLLATLREAQAALAAGRQLTWQQWAKLAKLQPANDGKAALAPVLAAAARHPAHPRLRADVETLVHQAFNCAAAALDLYATVKAREGVVDFTDQEMLALRLLDDPALRDELSRRLRLALVDEFQDTNPLQLALFVKLADLVGESIWVGDQKQAIYGFRGADPELVQEVSEMLHQAVGGERQRLGTCYRARAEIVDFVNDLFTAAFPFAGIPAADVAVAAARPAAEPGLDAPLRLWRLEASDKKGAAAALAAGVRRILDQGWPVADKRTGPRRARGSDIAVLCNSNERCAEVAAALAALGLAVAMPRPGLLDTPEALLAVAALRWLVDRSDTLALAQLVHLHPDGFAEGGWLEPWLRDGWEAVAAVAAPAAALDAARERLLQLTPAQALDLAISESGIARALPRWGNLRQRLANLDALRGLAARYQDMAGLRRGGATAAGFVTWLATGMTGGPTERKGGEQPASPDPDAVAVLTYHKAKGLEWPVTIVHDLDAQARDSPFGLHVEAPDGIDPRAPLAGRWLRYWPWPYGEQKKEVGLDAVADATAEARAAKRREQGERTRLLYVGMTRARDYLILARHKKTDWLDRMGDPQHRPLLVLPETDGPQRLTVRGRAHDLLVESLAPTAAEDRTAPARAADPVFVAPPPPPSSAHPPLRLIASAAGPGEAAAPPPRVVTIGGRLPLAGSADMAALGEAVHRFLAADRAEFDAARRLALAAAMLARWQVTALAPAHLVAAAAAFRAFVNAHWPGAVWRREVPVQGRCGRQRLSGRIDLLLDCADGLVVIDHKSFPGKPELWPAKAADHRPQLALYAEMVAAATGRPVLARLIHLPVVGAVALV